MLYNGVGRILILECTNHLLSEAKNQVAANFILVHRKSLFFLTCRRIRKRRGEIRTNDLRFMRRGSQSIELLLLLRTQ